MYTGSENRVKQNQVGSPLRAGSGRDTIAGPEEFNTFPSSDRIDMNSTQVTGQSVFCQIYFLSVSHGQTNSRMLRFPAREPVKPDTSVLHSLGNHEGTNS